MKRAILLIEDDAWLGELYTSVLETEENLYVRWVTSAEAALDALEEDEPFDLIILDIFLPQYNGIEFLHELATYEELSEVPVIILSSVTQRELAVSRERLRHYGVVECLYKPNIKPEKLLVTVKKQLIESKLTV